MIRAAVGFPSRSCLCPPEAAATQEAPAENFPPPVPRDWQGCSEPTCPAPEILVVGDQDTQGSSTAQVAGKPHQGGAPLCWALRDV